MGWDHATTRGAPPPPERVRLKSAMPSMTRRRTSSSRLCPAALMALDAAFAFASWLVVLNYTAGSSHVESHGCDAASSTPSGNAARVVARPRHSPPILSRCGFLLCPRFSVSWGWRAVARDAIFQARTPLLSRHPNTSHRPHALALVRQAFFTKPLLTPFAEFPLVRRSAFSTVERLLHHDPRPPLQPVRDALDIDCTSSSKVPR